MTIKWKEYYPLSDKNAFICLVDSMGDDSAIVQAARVSYGKDELPNPFCVNAAGELEPNRDAINFKLPDKDRHLIRYLMNHQHTTPFEMVEFKFMVQVPMDCWRQWIRHRTASINEYSTRYTEALDFFQVTDPTEWRLQATDNKQGSSGYLETWPENWTINTNRDIIHIPGKPAKCYGAGRAPMPKTVGEYLSAEEANFHAHASDLYKERLALGIAKEQARKDLPLSTYTRAYWKCDLHNIFNFLRLRMDSHAQQEIRFFANCMFEIVKQVCPVACEAFEDYVLHAKRFSRMEMEVIRKLFVKYTDSVPDFSEYDKPTSMTDREWKEFVGKLS
jgi:thymidylate synthase (FAD)